MMITCLVVSSRFFFKRGSIFGLLFGEKNGAGGDPQMWRQVKSGGRNTPFPAPIYRLQCGCGKREQMLRFCLGVVFGRKRDNGNLMCKEILEEICLIPQEMV